MQRSDITRLLLACLRDVLAEKSELPSEPLDESTDLIGTKSVLDSLGLVQLLADLEQRLQAEHQLSLTLADERALSQKNSPFRSVGALADYAWFLAQETVTQP
jgi:acyl carrier protein